MTTFVLGTLEAGQKPKGERVDEVLVELVGVPPCCNREGHR